MGSLGEASNPREAESDPCWPQGISSMPQTAFPPCLLHTSGAVLDARETDSPSRFAAYPQSSERP